MEFENNKAGSARCLEKIAATFESYWSSSEFEPYSEEKKAKLAMALRSERSSSSDENVYVIDAKPYNYQQEILDKLAAERQIHGCYRNLLVAATGTGKTVIAAFDYKRFRQENNGQGRLLFVAHREEILKQSLRTFRAILKDSNFGELYTGV